MLVLLLSPFTPGLLTERMRLRKKEKIDINRASPHQLSYFPRGGEILAQRIAEYRSKQEPFQGLSQILRVPGIGKLKLEKIKGKICLDQTKSGG